MDDGFYEIKLRLPKSDLERLGREDLAYKVLIPSSSGKLTSRDLCISLYDGSQVRYEQFPQGVETRDATAHFLSVGEEFLEVLEKGHGARFELDKPKLRFSFAPK